MNTRAVTITTQRARVDSVEGGSGGGHAVIFWVDSGVVYFGGSDVTTSNGLPVTGPAWSPAIEVDDVDGIWAISGGSVAIRVGQVN